MEGEINEPGTVTIQSQAMTNSRPATVDANGVFTGEATVAPGSNTLTIVATDASGNARTRQYGVTVDSLSASQSFGYDFNGNMTSRPGTAYHWDAENRLIRIEYAGEGQTEFSYDGWGHRVKVVEKNAGGTVTSEMRWIWSGGAQPCEERDAANKVTKRYFGYGLQTVDASDVVTNFFTMRDHLGSVRELVDSMGAVRARYEYDPYGRRTKTSGDLDADFGYTGHYFHERSGLSLALYRAYDAELGRWLSRDPIEEDGDINLYKYVNDSPVSNLDTLGLATIKIEDNKVRVHMNDVDGWPSRPHGDVLNKKGLKMDIEGNIWSKQTRSIVDKLSKSGKIDWREFLTKCGIKNNWKSLLNSKPSPMIFLDKEFLETLDNEIRDKYPNFPLPPINKSRFNPNSITDD